MLLAVNTANAQISGHLTVCRGASRTTLTGTPGGGVWSSGDVTRATINSSTGEVTGVASGTATITYVDPTTAVHTAVVTVRNYVMNPIGFSSGSAIRCTGGVPATCTVSPMNGNNWTSSDPTIATVNTGGLVVPSAMNTGTVTISYSHGYGNCYVTRDVSVNPTPTVSVTNPVCVGVTQTATGTPAGGTWSSSNTSVGTIHSTTGVLSSFIGGSTYIRYTAGGCLSQTQLTVTAAPAAIAGATTICVGNTSTLSSSTSGGTWSSSDPSVATIGSSSGVVSGVSTGTTMISYILGSGCFRTATVTVNAGPSASTGPDEVCVGQAISLTNATGGGSWSSSNTSKATVTTYGGTVVGVSAGTVNISYRVGGGCASVKTITVNGTMASISGGPNVCEGASVTLMHAVSGGTWTASNANATVDISSGEMTGVTAGSVNITYTASPGCVKVQMMIVKSTPAAITGALTVCPGATTALSSASGGGTWSSGNTSVATINTYGVVSGVASGTATISYANSAGCYTMAVVTVSSTGGGISGSTSLCLGSAATLTSSPTGGTWSSSNTSVVSVGSLSGLVTAISPGTAVISYFTSGGCTSLVLLTVDTTADAGIITGPSLVDVGNTMTLASEAGGGVWSSSNSGVATVGSTGVVSGISVGTVNISYTITNSCGAAIAVKIVDVSISAISGMLLVCPDSVTALTSASAGGSWESGNSSIATVGSGTGIVTGVSSGTAYISYHLGSSFLTVVVTVSMIPEAGTISGSLLTTVGGTTVLSGSVGGGSWSSSDTAIATVGSSGIVVGIAPGTAIISYLVANSCGSSYATAELNVSISGISGSLEVCTGSTTTLSSASPGGTWSSSSESVASIGSATGIVMGISEGTSTITYSLGGSVVTAVLTVGLTADAGSISGPAVVQVGATVMLSASISGGVWSSANTAIATVGSTGIVTGVADGMTTIYYIKSASCVADTANQTISVYTIPTGKPIVSSLSASSGNNGSTLTITGNNFSSVDSFNRVWFGSVKGTVTASSATSLSVTIPTGAQYAPIQITNLTNGLSGYTQQNFTPTFDNSGDVPMSVYFDDALTLSLPGDYGVSVAIGDLDNDGKPEILGASGETGLTIYRNSSTPGSLSASSFSSFSVSSVDFCLKVAVHDMDGDGKMDIVFSGVPGMYILRNIHSSGSLSTSSFASPVTVSASSVGSPYIDDVDGDGKPDIIGLSGTAINVLRNVGTPGSITTSSFESPVSFSVNATAQSLSIGDIDGDGKKDVTVASHPSSSLSVLRNNSTPGTISYDTKYDLPAAASEPYGVAVGDLNVDGKPEVVVSCIHDVPCSYHLNEATSASISASSFAEPEYINVGFAYGLSIALADINGDSRPDAVVGDDWGNRACVSLNRPIGAYAFFEPDGAFNLPGGSYPRQLVTGDLDGDGRPEVVACKLFDAKLVVLRNNPIPRVFGDESVCVGATSTYAIAATGGTWSSLSSAIATIGSTTGIVNGVAPGVVIIRYTLPSGVSSSKTITVNPFGGNIGPFSTVAVGAAISLTIYSGTAGGTWSTSDSAVATVSSTGLVTGISPGSVLISYSVGVACGTAVSTRSVTVTGSKPGIRQTTNAPASLSIFPNPSSGSFTVQSDSGGVASINSLDGRTLLQFHVNTGGSTISMPDGTGAGVYLLKFFDGYGNVQVLRLVYNP